MPLRGQKLGQKASADSLTSIHPMRSLINKSFLPIIKKTMNFANMELNWQLGDVTTSAKGIKLAPLTDGTTAA